MENVFVEKWRVLWYDVSGGDCNGEEEISVYNYS